MGTNVIIGIIPGENHHTGNHPTPAEIYLYLQEQFFQDHLIVLMTETKAVHITGLPKHRSEITPIITLRLHLRMKDAENVIWTWTEKEKGKGTGRTSKITEETENTITGREIGIEIEITMQIQGINIPILPALPPIRPLPPVFPDLHRTIMTTHTTIVSLLAEIMDIASLDHLLHHQTIGNIKGQKTRDQHVNLRIPAGMMQSEVCFEFS